MASLAYEGKRLNDEYKALESECFMITILDDIAMEDTSSELGSAKMERFFAKASAILKKIFMFIPKLIGKLIEKIKHSRLMTEKRANADIPEDLKNIGNDKLNNIKKLRVEILDAKQKLLEMANKKMEAAIALSEKLYIEMTAVAKIFNAAGSNIDNQYKTSASNIHKLTEDFNKVVNTKLDDLIETLRSRMQTLKSVCEDERLFAISVPTYKGTDKSGEYASKITQNCTKYSKLASEIGVVMRKGAGRGSGLNTVIVHNDKTRAKGDAELNSSSAYQVVQLYTKCANQFQKVSEEYTRVCAAVYKVYQIVDDNKTVEHKSDSEGGATTGKYDGRIVWSESEKCWTYQEQALNARNNLEKYTIYMRNETNKDEVPDPSIDDVKKAREAIKKQGASQLFDLDEDAVKTLKSNASK